jgi:hypothetical protein
MRRHFFARLAWAASLAAAFLAPTAANAQGKANVDKVKFDTCDGVELHGSFYPGRNGPKSTCVLLLHNITSGDSKKAYNSQQAGWDQLATALQAKGFAVLSFDFRGHGNSTGIQPGFWKFAHNGGVRGFGKAEAIRYQDYQRSYYPILVNDIAAAKTLLDRRNDNGECNSRSIILVGAQEGGVLGTMWAMTEWQRYQLVSQFPIRLDTNPEGKSVVACVWLSMTGTQSEQSSWLKALGKDHRIPMGFLYGAGDATAANFAQKWAKDLKGKASPTDKFTRADGTPKSTLAGHDLLRKDLDTVDKIVTYCEKVMEAVTPAEPAKVEFEKKGYAYSFQGGTPILRKKPDEKLLGPIPITHIGVRTP